MYYMYVFTNILELLGYLCYVMCHLVEMAGHSVGIVYILLPAKPYIYIIF